MKWRDFAGADTGERKLETRELAPDTDDCDHRGHLVDFGRGMSVLAAMRTEPSQA